MSKKISIIMPTYNDSDTICETLDTVFKQSYENWELIIIDDGSTDSTKKTIYNYKEKNDKKNRIKYYYQNNSDQLNAILNAINYITGDYVYILHSDDLLNEENTFEKCVKFLNHNPKLDAIISDLITIDNTSKITGFQKVSEYKNSRYILPLQLLWLGRNLYVDSAFHTKNSFIKNVKSTYLTWNIPFWILPKNSSLTQLNVKKVNFPFIKYRVHNENYINNFNGKLNVINGELRTLTILMKYYNIPLYKTQYTLYRIFNKLGVKDLYRPLYTEREQKSKQNIVEFAIKKRFGNDYKNNKFLNALVEFYKLQNHRTIIITSNIEKVYQGKDMRIFNNDLLAGNLDSVYDQIIEEMKYGFDKIIINTKDDLQKIEDVCKFLCIYPFIEIEVK